MSKKVKHDKNKPRKGRGRGASSGSAGAPIGSEAAPVEALAAQPEGSPEPEETPKAPKAPKGPKLPVAPSRLNGVDKKAQQDKHSAFISSRSNSSQLRAKAGAHDRKIQSQRGGSR